MLNRILLIYDHYVQILAEKHSFDGSVLASAADILRHFVEEYHEKLEEEFLFPRFRKAGKLVRLVDTLEAQHKAGRELTAKIRDLAGVATLKYVSSDSEKLADALRAFLRMYRPHEAREDTVLSRRFVPLFPLTSTMLWETISRRRKTNCSGTKAFSRWSTRLRSWRRSWASTTWPNLHQSNTRNGAVLPSHSGVTRHTFVFPAHCLD